MSRPKSKERDLILSDYINATTVKPIIESIMEINTDDDLNESEYIDWQREPIRLFINSFGGSVYDGLALVDIIKQSKTPVYTICVGSCMSMGLWIWLSGSKRLVGESATLMFHDIADCVYGKTEVIKQELNESLRLQNMIIKEVTSTSLVKEEVLRDYINRKAEWYIPAEEAINLKLAHEYYK